MDLKKLLLFVLLLSFLAPSAQAMDSKRNAKVFMLTSTYGVMAGTFTGLATLAFYDSPSNHLRNVALGASVGLYTGILLGAYLVSMVPDPNEKKEAPKAEEKKDENEKKLDENPPLGEWPRWSPILVAQPQQWQLGVSYRF